MKNHSMISQMLTFFGQMIFPHFYYYYCYSNVISLPRCWLASIIDVRKCMTKIAHDEHTAKRYVNILLQVDSSNAQILFHSTVIVDLIRIIL